MSNSTQSTQSTAQHTTRPVSELRLTTAETAPALTYAIAVDGAVQKQTSDKYPGAAELIQRTAADGTTLITGVLGHGEADTFTITGDVVRATIDAPDDHYTVTVNGHELTATSA